MTPNEKGPARHHSDEATSTTRTTTDQGNGSTAQSTSVHSIVDLGSHAIAYARARLDVFPVMPGGKEPLAKLVPHGHLQATSDVEQVRDWWVQEPEANIGIRPAVGVVVVDVDPRDCGATNLAALIAEHGHLVPTWTAHTGGGGLHAWFRTPGPYRGKLCPGVDLKGHSGYVVAPPSLHASSRRYVWGNELAIALAPRWLAKLVVAPAVQPRTITAGMPSGPADDGLVRTVAQAPQGERNHLVFWAACRAMERGGSPELLARIAAAARANGLGKPERGATVTVPTPGANLDEVDRTIGSAAARVGVPA